MSFGLINLGVNKRLRTYYDFTSTKTTDAVAVSENEFEITTRYDRDKIYTVELHDDDYKITHIDYVDTKRDN